MNRHPGHSAKYEKGAGYLKYSIPSAPSGFVVESKHGDESRTSASPPAPPAQLRVSRNVSFQVGPGQGHGRARKGKAGGPLAPPSSPNSTTSAIAAHGRPHEKISGSLPKHSQSWSNQRERTEATYIRLGEQFQRMEIRRDENEYESVPNHPSMWRDSSTSNLYDNFDMREDELSLGEAFLLESLQSDARKKNHHPIFPTPSRKYLKDTPATRKAKPAPSKTKVEYMPDYESVRSKLLTLVEKEKKRRPPPGTAVPSTSSSSSLTMKPKFNPVASSSSATSFPKKSLKPNDTSFFNESKQRTKVVNEQLNNLSKIFRENVKASVANPVDVIKTPMLSDKMWNKLGRKLSSEVLLSRDVSHLFSSDEEDGKADNGRDRNRNATSNASKARENDDELIELRTLLQQNADAKHCDIRREPKPRPPSEVPQLTPTRDRDPYAEAQKLIQAFRDAEHGMLPIDLRLQGNGDSASAWSSEGKTRTEIGHPYQVPISTIPIESLRARTGETVEAVVDKLGKSGKTLEDAAKIANELGSLMGRLTARREDERERNEQQHVNESWPASGNATATTDTQTGIDVITSPSPLASCGYVPSSKFNYSMPTTEAKSSPAPTKPKGFGFGVQTTGQETQEIQTDVSISVAGLGTGLSWSVRDKISQITFAKDMSPEDQRQLHQLRLQKQEWEKFKFQG